MAQLKDAWPKKSMPNGHPADGMTLQVDLGEGAWSSIPDPRHEGGLEWSLRYGNAEDVRFVAATVLSSYEYLLHAGISQKEAFRRLRMLRAAHAEAWNIGPRPFAED